MTELDLQLPLSSAPRLPSLKLEAPQCLRQSRSLHPYVCSALSVWRCYSHSAVVTVPPVAVHSSSDDDWASSHSPTSLPPLSVVRARTAAAAPPLSASQRDTAERGHDGGPVGPGGGVLPYTTAFSL
jgi:hypothetical protein